MSSVEGFMEQALIDLKMAEERAKFFNYSSEEIDHIRLLERAVWRVRQQIIEKKLSASGVIVTTPLGRMNRS